jgi:hypothetical protein
VSVNCTAAPTPGEVGEYENEAAGAAGVLEEGGDVEGGVEPGDDPSPQPCHPKHPRARPAASRKRAVERVRLIGVATPSAAGGVVVDLMTITCC